MRIAPGIAYGLIWEVNVSLKSLAKLADGSEQDLIKEWQRL